MKETFSLIADTCTVFTAIYMALRWLANHLHKK